jgi:SAM-dependent methyltransferase
MTPLQTTYDLVAADYARHLGDDLAHKPFDRLMLQLFLEKVPEGPIADVGCGPGQVARFLRDEGGQDVFGVDLSPGMVEQARLLHPDIEFEVGDFTALDVPDGAWAGAVAFYSIVHTPTHKLAGPFLELARVVRKGGWLLLAFHSGFETKHLDTWWDHDVDIDVHFHHRGSVHNLLKASGWRVRESMERKPYAEDVEHPSRRAYMLMERI